MPDQQRKQRILSRQTVMTRDGIPLCTDAFLTPIDQPAPTVVVRTPYGRMMPPMLRLATRLSHKGCCVVLQDCRGRFQSKGTYEWRREENDSYDTLCWLAEQPWADGRVGLFGVSVTAHPNFFVASAPWPPGIEIQSMVSIMGSVNHYAIPYREGALVLHWALPWSIMMTDDEMGRTGWKELPWPEVFRHLPLQSAAETHATASENWDMMISSPAFGEMWQQFDARSRIAGLPIPTLHLAGWYDFMLHHSLESYGSMTRPGEPPPGQQRLVVGPWDHWSLFESFGKRRQGPDQGGSSTAVDLLELVALWFERWLLDIPDQDEASEEADVMLYLVGEDSWLGAGAYPLAEAEIEDWYLLSGGRAHQDANDGRLVREKPGQVGRDAFSYDPENPVPTKGGSVWPFPLGKLVPGAADQSEIEERADVLVYTSSPLEDDVVVVGPLEVELWASTSARDTDFTAKLVDVDPSGLPRIVQDGIVRGRFHRSLQQEELLEPHRPYCFTLSLHATARRFSKGHRIRLEISSSNFPKFDRSLNTATPLHQAATGIVAHQTVFHGGEMGSRLRLPVVPRARLEALRTLPAASWRAEG